MWQKCNTNTTCISLYNGKANLDIQECNDRSVTVTGITETITKNRLESFFKSRKRGGPIEEVRIHNPADSALIIFKNREGKFYSSLQCIPIKQWNIKTY